MATYSFYIKDGELLVPISPTIHRAHAVVEKTAEGLEIGTPSFRVGSHQVKVFLNGLLVPETIGFTEKADGTGISILYSLEVGDEIDVEVVSSSISTGS